MKAIQKRPTKNPTVGIRQFDDTAFLLDASHSQLHELNNTGAFIWFLCDGQHPTNEIAKKISEQFEIDQRQALQDLQAFLEILANKNLLTFEE